ncbi:unnamed protein product, partial [Polarella glacialis]
VGGFTSAADPGSRRGSLPYGAVARGSGPVHLEYLPHDREADLQRRLDSLRRRLDAVRRSRAESSAEFQALLQAEAEESTMLQDALREQLARVRRRRLVARDQADVVVSRHLELEARLSRAK